MEENIENELQDTSYGKGINLEKEFCEFLKTDLGWDKARIRSQMASKSNMRGTNVDVIAERKGIKGIRLERLGSFYIIGFGLLILFGFYQLYIEKDIVLGEELLMWGMPFEFIGIVVLLLSGKYIKEHAWVECKNLKGKVNINQIQKTINEVQEYNQSNDNQYRFIETYFVTTNGFIENALNLASKNEIRCFVKEGDTFKEIDYWEH